VRRPWYLWSVAMFFAMLVVSVLLKSWQEKLFPGLDLTVRLTTDLLGGLSATAFVLGATACLQAGHPLTGMARLMASKGPVTVGAFSYSLYLIHYPILAAVATTLIARHYGGMFDTAVMLASVPLVCLAAFGFYWLFERPYLNRRSEKTV
jgi:peptidoglycan/LPS O-acetylase OafA/YrhL